MADTGAPWNIPYVEPSDLVRNYPAANELMADAIAAGLTAAGNPGIGSNVVSVTKTDTFSTSSATFVPVTGLTATITPSTATSKILVLCYAPVAQTSFGSGNGVYLQLVRGATPIAIADAASLRRRSTYGITGLMADENVFAVTMTFLDAPASASAVTYGVEIARGNAGTAVVNRSGLDADNAVNPRMVATMTVIEVAA